MKSKITNELGKNWFVIIEMIIAAEYAVSVYLKTANGLAQYNYWLLNLGVPIVMALFSNEAVDQYIKKSDSKIFQTIAIACAAIIAVDTCMNDSLVGIAFIAILLINLIRNEDDTYKVVIQLFLCMEIVAEIISILSLTDVIHTDAIMFQSVRELWIDLVLVITVILYIFVQDGKIIKGYRLRTVLTIVVIVINFMFVVALCFGAYLRTNQYYLAEEQIEDGTSVYIVSADGSNKALTCDGNKVTAESFTNSDNQIYTFEESEEKGYWHIVTENSLVLDITNVLYEEGNTVIAWEENGVSGQNWKVDDIGNNMVKITSFEPAYELTWGNHTEEDGSVLQRTYITSNTSDVKGQFILKSAETIGTPFVGWIVNGNGVAVIVAFIVLTVLIIIVGLRRMISNFQTVI